MKRTLSTLGIAICLVLLIRSCAFTSCTIPFSGMENTLFQGDRVIVNRWSYGLRLPFPSLIGYHRWNASTPRQGDIVVFNNPAPQAEDTPIEQRELYISRCIGAPGDTLMLNEQLVNIGEERIICPDDKTLYAYPGEREEELADAMQKAGVVGNELMGYDKGDYIRSFSHYELYLIKQVLEREIPFTSLQSHAASKANPFVIPTRGQKVNVYPWNAKLLCNTINSHEGKKAQLRGTTLIVDGKKTNAYTFTQDYCWVASGHSVNVCDSRLFGLVPESHLIGRADMVWFSKDPTASWNEGFRWSRFFHHVTP